MNPLMNADGMVAVTPSDSKDLDFVVSGIEVEVTGDVAMVCANGMSITRELTAGRIYPVRVKKVLATGTTATGIYGYLY